MGFQTEEVVSDAIDRLRTQAGAVLVGGLTLFSVVRTAAGQDIARGVIDAVLEELEGVIAVVVGFLLLVLPGLLVVLFLVFFPVATVVDDQSFFGAFASSAGVVRENILGAVAIVLVGIVAGIVISIVSTVVERVLPAVPGALVGELFAAVTVAFTLGDSGVHAGPDRARLRGCDR